MQSLPTNTFNQAAMKANQARIASLRQMSPNPFLINPIAP